MAPRGRLKPYERQEIMGGVKLRVSLRDISNQLNIPYSTVKYTKQKAERRDPQQHDLKRSGRPRKSIPEDDQRLYRHTKINTSLLWEEVLQLTTLSKNSVRRRFKEIDPDWRLFIKKWRPHLTPNDAIKRQLYCQSVQHWRAEDWANVWFTDECSIQIGTGEIRQ